MKLFKKNSADQINPLIEAGLTYSDEENVEQHHRMKSADGVTVLQDVSQVTTQPGTRVPTPRFIARDDEDTIWSDGVHADRLQRGAVTSFPKEVVEAMRTGHICISCLEPHAVAFPIECDLCGYAMSEFQPIAFATQFEGTTNYGPSMTLQAIDEARRMEAEMSAFDRKIMAGKSKMKGLLGRG